MRTTARVVVGLVLVVVAAAAVLALTGRLPGGAGSDLPPCGTLPTSRDARAAVTAHPALERSILDAAPGVRVDVVSVCDGEAAVVHVTYDDDGDRARIDSAIAAGTGFGVPVQVEQR